VSWNRIVLTLLIACSLSTSIAYAQKLMPISEDELIMRGLLYDEYKSYENSYQVYKNFLMIPGQKSICSGKQLLRC
jgi:hypothetical protein